MRFSLGDEVTGDPTGPYGGQGKDKHGVVTSLMTPAYDDWAWEAGFRYVVEWDGEYENSYKEEDLLPYPKSTKEDFL